MDIITRKTAQELGLIRYYTGKSCKRGHVVERTTKDRHCVECRKEKTAGKYSKYREYQRKYQKEYGKKYRKENTNYYKQAYNKWRKENPEKVAEHARFYLWLRDKATPVWADMDKIKLIYLKRDKLIETTNTQYHVDHVVPLQGKNVCGLHCEQNLQILEASINLSKSNTFKE